MYVIDCIIPPSRRQRIAIDVDESFSLTHVKLESGKDLKVERVTTIDKRTSETKDILSTEYSLGTAVTLINLRRPYLKEGSLILTIRNPLPREQHLKATIE